MRKSPTAFVFGPLAALALSSCQPATAASLVTRLGNEFQANSTTFLWQREPSVAALSNGQVIVVWKDESRAAPDTSGTAVRGRRFSHTGVPIAADFVVNTVKTQNQQQPTAARLGNGRFVVAWADNSLAGLDKSGYAIRSQRFANTGVRIGSEVQVNTVPPSDQDSPSVAALTNGGFAVGWESGPGFGQIGAQAFTSTGAKSGGDVLVNNSTGETARGPALAGLAGGTFVAAWTDLGPATSSGRGSLDIKARRLASNGARLGSELLINKTIDEVQQAPAVAYLGNNEYVVVWEDQSGTGADTSGSTVRGQIWSAAGAKVGGQFLVPTHLTGDQNAPAVAAFPNGRFLVVWTDPSGFTGDTSGTAIRAQLYSRAGQRIGSEFRVNLRSLGDQEDPAVATFNNTDFVVVWTDWSNGQLPDQSASGVRGQVFHLNQ